MTLYNIEEAAELVGVPYKTLWYHIATGKLQESHRVGRVRLFDDYDVAEMKQFFERRSSRSEGKDDIA